MSTTNRLLYLQKELKETTDDIFALKAAFQNRDFNALDKLIEKKETKLAILDEAESEALEILKCEKIQLDNSIQQGVANRTVTKGRNQFFSDVKEVIVKTRQGEGFRATDRDDLPLLSEEPK